jgi:adenosylcobinamide-GDP ribazoletransferase
MAAVARSQPYAHPEGGTASAFVADRAGPHPALGRSAVAVYGLALAGGLAVFGAGTRGVVVVAAEIAAGAAVVWFARRRLGGYTGDVLGASGVIGETVGLLVLVAR